MRGCPSFARAATLAFSRAYCVRSPRTFLTTSSSAKNKNFVGSDLLERFCALQFLVLNPGSPTSVTILRKLFISLTFIITRAISGLKLKDVKGRFAALYL